jgi:hypothetical protein
VRGIGDRLQLGPGLARDSSGCLHNAKDSLPGIALVTTGRFFTRPAYSSGLGLHPERPDPKGPEERGEDSVPGDRSTSEPHPSQDVEAGDEAKPPERDNLDD